VTGPHRAREAGSRPRRRAGLHERRARRRRAGRWLLAAAAAAVVFVAGLSLGRALEDAPRPGGTQTLVRTLEPETLPPITRTVTVTTTG
jgi:hypothetical protein